MELKEAVKSFFFWQKSSGRSPATFKAYRATLESLLHQENDLTGIDPQALQNFISTVPTPASRNAKKSAIKSFFRWATETDLIEKDPARTIHLEKLPFKEARYMSPKEVHKFREAIKGAGRNRLLFETFLNTGLRLTECLSLNCSIKGKTVIQVCGKGRKTRSVFLPKPLVKLIAESINGNKPDEPLFRSSRDGGRLSPVQVQNLFKCFLAKAEIKSHYSIHALRHTFLTAIYNRTKDLRLTQELAGHSSPLTTARYAHVNQASKVEAINSLWGK